MALTETVLRAFVASPKDVNEERAVLADVIDELNVTWSRTFELRMELLKWETHTYPAVGTSAQAVINDQIGDDYDIFIGIMWTHFGTSTETYDSGTEEEFYRALSKHSSEGDRVRILFYFKDAPVAPSDIDVVQLQKVQAFRDKLGEEGSYYWKFKDVAEFSELARVHLSRVIQSYLQQRQILESKIPVKPFVAGVSATEDDEPGFLDLLEQGQEMFEIAAVCVNRMTSAMEEVSAATSQRAQDMDALVKRSVQFDLQAVKKIATLSAQDMELYVSRMDAEIPMFADTYQKALDSVTAAANLSVSDFTPNVSELRNLREVVSTHAASLESYRDSTVNLKGTIIGLPRLHSVFNKAKRKTIRMLDTLIEKISFVRQLNCEAVKLLGDLVTKVEKQSEVPQDFVEALEDFDKQRFVSMEIALNEVPPNP